MSLMSCEEADCPLCLAPLESHDYSHPLQCPSRHCHFNCCTDCLKQMIKATKDDRSEASDGNAFRVFLHCPNCRSNLGPSIRDTLLLRKVDKYKAFHRQYTADGVEVIDEKLSASELRSKYALEKDEDVASAIELAQDREDEFFGRNVEEEELMYASSTSLSSCGVGSYISAKSIWSFDDEEGFEADIQGSKSFIFRHHSREDDMMEADELRRFEDVKQDPTLLCGLDAFMTHQEQQFMTAQLISGDVTKLAAATELMHYVSALSREGIKPSLKRQQSHLTRNQSLKRDSMLEGIKEVIREGNEARRLEEEREAAHEVGLAPPSRLYTSAQKNVTFGGRARGKRHEKMLADIEMKREMTYMALHPLPLRMPKYAEATATHPFGVTFVDDMWDGTLLDAFSKITVSTSILGHVTVTKQHAESEGVHRIISACARHSPKPPSSQKRLSPSLPRPRSPHSTAKITGRIDAPSPRVVVASINREMGRQGVVAGDVLTHLNGEEFHGSTADLIDMINCRYEGEVLTFVFNADAAVAEVLKRRSMISTH